MPDGPVRVGAKLDEPLSRWLWLVKWLLAIPHYIVLWFLWITYLVLTVIAFFAILFTGRYPSSIFDFNVGVLRWSWRVAYYSYGVLGTDRYPPFTLAEVPDYPATLTIDYPERMSRGLVLVKWWLLAIPHYVVVGIFLWGGYTVATNENSPPGLIAVLVLFAAIALLFTGRYPKGMFDFVVGMNRWALRVAAYASLMTDAYPPFRLDGGAQEPSEPSPVPPDMATAATRPGAEAAEAAEAKQTTEPIPSPVAPSQRSHWSAGRVVSVVVGAVLLVIGLSAIAGGTWVAWADQTQRDQAGYLNTSTARFVTADYGLRYDTIWIGGQDWDSNLDWLGTMRVRATGSADDPLFIGIAQTSDVNRFFGQPSIQRFGSDSWDRYGPHYRPGPTDRPPTAPEDQTFWAASASGSGPQSITWDPRDGRWTLIAMNADASAGVDAEVSAGATLPHLRTVWIVLFVVGGIATAAGALLMVFAIRMARRPAGISGR